MEQIPLAWEPERRIYSVSELNGLVRGALEREFSRIWVAGEISGVRLAPSGHYYFSLKDDTGLLRSVCYKGTARYLKFRPQDGVAVLARGSVSVFELKGEMQFIVEALEPQGHGALQFAFEQLKKKLAAEGLFDSTRKRPLPKYPRRIGIVTSATGAVIRDMLNILERRFPGLHVRLYPALVQGEGSISAVCEGIRWFSESRWADVVIVGRGGGSLEDLWTFNEESVARAIAACSAPVISAVGHETDFTIADFVADLRAPTPSAAAELVVCTRQDLLDQLAREERKMHQFLRHWLSEAYRKLEQQGTGRATTLLHRNIGRFMQRVDELDYSLREKARDEIRGRHRVWQDLESRLRKMDLRLRFAEAHRRIEAARNSLRHCALVRIHHAQRRLEPMAANLYQLSPLRVLDRGYAIVQDENGAVVKTSTDTAVDALLNVRLSKGTLKTRVIEKN